MTSKIRALLSASSKDLLNISSKDESGPDKDEVGKAFDRTMIYAEKANGFTEAIGFTKAIDKLRLPIEQTAVWLGENWYKLLPLVGLVT